MAATTQLVKDVSPLKLGFLAAAALAALIGAVVVLVRLSTPPLVQLFSDLTPEDSARVSSKLDSMGLSYQFESRGSKILVPASKLLHARVQLAKKGLPTSGATVGYEIFDKDEKIGVSGFVYKVNLVRALEGELSRTITALDSVSSARVHLALPKRELFSSNRNVPSASVIIQLEDLLHPPATEIEAIAHLVAAAVPGLDPSRVAIADTKGRPLKRPVRQEDNAGALAAKADEYRTKIERKLKHSIEDLLSRSVGFGKIEAQVSAEVDLDRIVTDQETYDPDSSVVRSTHSTEQRDNAENKEQTETSVASNLPGDQESDQGTSALSSSEKNDTITNYELSRTTRKIIKGTGEIKRLSVAILVDGTYKKDQESEEYVYTPRTQEELDKLAELARGAVGFNETRGDTLKIVSMEFSKEILEEKDEDPFEWLKRDLNGIIKTLIAGLIITLIILLIIKPIIKKSFEKSEEDQISEVDINTPLTQKEMEELNEIAGIEEAHTEPKKDDWLNIDRVEDKSKDSSVSAINDLIEKHPREATTVLRSWMEKD